MATKEANRFVSKELSKLYAQHREGHSKEFYKFIVDVLTKKHPAPDSLTLAVDVGCGTGSSTRPLAEHFKDVVGVDVSETQLEEARIYPGTQGNIQYKVGSFNSLPVEDGTADLVTVSQAVHWFTPIESFYKEVDRALKPGGCLAVYEYGNERFPEQYQERISSFIQELLADKRLAPYQNAAADRKKGLETITTPYSDVTRDSSFSLSVDHTIESLYQNWLSRSTYHLYAADHPGERGPLEDFIEKVKNLVGDGTKFTTQRPVYLVMGRKPLT